MLRDEIAKRLFLTAYPDGDWGSFKTTNAADWYWGDADTILALVRTALLSEASVEAFDKAMKGKMANIQYVRPALAAAIDEAGGDVG